jgi:hypothetical protein
MELKNDGLTRERDGAKCAGGNGVVTSRHISPLLTTETVVIKRSGIQPFGFVVVYLFEVILGIDVCLAALKKLGLAITAGLYVLEAPK